MISSGSKLQQFILHSSVPIICSIIVGLIFYGDGVFNRYHSSFQFIWSALVASVFYNLLISVRSRDAYLGLIILLLLTSVTTKSTRPVFILRDILYIAGIEKYIHWPTTLSTPDLDQSDGMDETIEDTL